MAFVLATGLRRACGRDSAVRLLLAALFAAGTAALPADRAEAAEPAPPRPVGTSDDAARDAARKAIPWNQLGAKDRRIAHYLVRNHSVFRRMPTQTIECRSDIFTFLAQRPEVVTGVWNVMGVSQLEVVRTGPGKFRAVDHAGTSGVLRQLHADWGDGDGSAAPRQTVVFYAQGVYEAKPLPRPIKAHSLLVLHSASQADADGVPRVTARLDSFIHFERATADLVARTLSPLITRTADHNFVETMNFISTFSRTTDRNPAGVARLARRLEKLDDGVRGELLLLCQTSAERGPRVSLVGGESPRR